MNDKVGKDDIKKVQSIAYRYYSLISMIKCIALRYVSSPTGVNEAVEILDGIYALFEKTPDELQEIIEICRLLNYQWEEETDEADMKILQDAG